MADEHLDDIPSLKQKIIKLFEASLKVTFPDGPNVVPLIAHVKKEAGSRKIPAGWTKKEPLMIWIEYLSRKFGMFGMLMQYLYRQVPDKKEVAYQCNNAMSLWARIRHTGTEFTGPESIALAIMRNLPPNDIIESCCVAGPGYVNVTLSKQWMAQSIHKMLIDGIDTWAPKLPVKRAIVDFSSPNVAMEMHVGHLRSTIIGDTLARMLEFSKVEVLRRNHVGDWGIQFGMLIEYLFEKFPNEEVNDQAIGELEVFYKASKKRFDDDPVFKKRAQEAVVSLQGGDERYLKAWAQICEISRKGFEQVYERLDVHLEEKGESFYNPYIGPTLDLLREKGLIESDAGAQVIRIPGNKQPLIVVKSDGGFNYDSTVLAALWYRLNVENAELIVYVTDIGQHEHFDMFFTAAKLAGWLPTKGEYPKACHVGFGYVLGDDGKRFWTGNTKVVTLLDLLDEAKSRSKVAIVKRAENFGKTDADWTAEELEELEHTAEAVGYGAVKYADLKKNRLTNYNFNYDQMLSVKGNTAVYVLYAHSRACSVLQISGKDIEKLKDEAQIVLEKDVEHKLGIHLLRFAEAFEEACIKFLPNVLCEYLYGLAEKFSNFYEECKVVGSPEASSRLLLCEATRVVMRNCLQILGITPLCLEHPLGPLLLVDSLLAKAKKEIGYTWNCKENVENLRSEVANLKDMAGRVQQRIKVANDKGDKLLTGVERWVDEALALISTTEEFLEEEASAKKTCFNLRMCVNLNTLHHYGKQATNKVPSLEEHQKDGVVYESDVSIPTPPPGILELNQRKNYDDLDTHKSALENIINSIQGESTQITGIYGIGGVGKTTLAKEVAARVKDLFDLVVFVTVSQRVDATKIQKEVEAAAKRIMKGEKILIILDDLWKEQKLDEAGIPSVTSYPNFKILLTSRKIRVCEAMNAQKNICVDTLPIKEAWIFFKRVVGERVDTDAKLKVIAMKVVEGCGGLPLILQAVGNALKNEESITRWKKAVEKIEKHATADIDPDIRLAFANLKLSYDYLETEESKSCFLLCGMFPEDFCIPLERLAYYGVGLQVFKDLESLEDARDRVQNAVELLQSSCLLLHGDDEFTTKMHNVVREGALLIASKDNNKYLVEAGKDLIEWEPRNESLESYTGISLMENNICKLPASHELKIPLLDIFLIQNNPKLSEISDEFVLALKEVRVVDFEYNNISSLPKSLNQLTRLRMLNLGGNKYLCDVSMVGELKCLEILILSNTGITGIPQEIGKLVKLRLFNVKNCPLSHIAPGVLLNLHGLEELSIGYFPPDEGNDNSLLEIGELHLTFLTLYVRHIDLISRCDYVKRLKRFSIRIDGRDHPDLRSLIRGRNRIQGDRTMFLGNHDLDISHSMHLKKMIDVCDGIALDSIGNLANIMPTISCEGFGLKTIHIDNCANLLSLVDSRVVDEKQTFQASKTREGVKENRRFLSEVEQIRLSDLSSLNVIWSCRDQYISLNNLVTFEINDCPALERLFSVSVAEGLANLQTLTIDRCKSLKEVIWDENGESSMGEINTVEPATEIVFPYLAHIELLNLDNLTSFYPRNAMIKYPSLVNVKIRNCYKLEKWGQGTHDAPNLHIVNNTNVNGYTLDDACSKGLEARITAMFLKRSSQ